MAGQGSQRVHAVLQVRASGRTRLIVLDTQDLSLGRSPENDLAIDEPEMSRKHAVLERTAEGFRIDDMGTSNGTRVNGESVDHAVLSHGDVIRIGEVEITYAQTTRNPASLGPSVEYASQFKSFGSPMAGCASDGEATILGLVDTIGDPGDASLEIQPAGDFDLALNAERPPGTRPRNLDEEVADLDADSLEDLGFDEVPAGVDEVDPGSGPDPVWVLDDDDADPVTARARPAPVRPAAPAPGKASAPGRIALTLEIDGAEGELRRILLGLAGKVLEVPSLRVRVKSEDLG